MNKTLASVSWSSLAALGFVLIGAGCSNIDDSGSPTSPDKSSNPAAGKTGLAVSSAALKSSKTKKIKFKVERVRCQGNNLPESASGNSGGKVHKQIKGLEEMTLPGGIAKFEDEPFDSDSEHQFADAYFTLEAGCYNVKTIPLKKEKSRNDKCQKARASSVEVEDGTTEEILLINQCEGKKRGGLDVISAINHPPHIKKLKYRPSKFLQCKDRGAICYTAKDPDGDPMRSKVKFVGSEPKHRTKPFPKKFLRKCKTYCDGDNNNGPIVMGNDGARGDRCLPRCVDHLRHERKKKCKKRCKRKCDGDNGNNTPTNVDGGNDGPRCKETCRESCLTPRGKLKRCILVNPKRSKSYNAVVKVFDRLWSDIQRNNFSTEGNNQNGGGYDYDELVDFEEYYDTDPDYDGDTQSRDTLSFPIHVGGECKEKDEPCKCKKHVDVKGYLVKDGGRWDFKHKLRKVGKGDKVKVVFEVSSKIKKRCKRVKLSFASYTSKDSVILSGSSNKRRLYDIDVGKFGPGKHKLGPIKMPSCSFQVGLTCGDGLTGRQLENDGLERGRKLAWGAGGWGQCDVNTNGGCTKPPGWWKSCRFGNDLQSEKLGGQSFLSLLNMNASSKLWLKVAKYWIASKASILFFDAWVPPFVGDMLYRCGGLLKDNVGYIPYRKRHKAKMCEKVLSKYVGGKIGPGKCRGNGPPNGTNG